MTKKIKCCSQCGYSSEAITDTKCPICGGTMTYEKVTACNPEIENKWNNGYHDDFQEGTKTGTYCDEKLEKYANGGEHYHGNEVITTNKKVAIAINKNGHPIYSRTYQDGETSKNEVPTKIIPEVTKQNAQMFLKIKPVPAFILGAALGMFFQFIWLIILLIIRSSVLPNIPIDEKNEFKRRIKLMTIGSVVGMFIPLLLSLIFNLS